MQALVSKLSLWKSAHPLGWDFSILIVGIIASALFSLFPDGSKKTLLFVAMYPFKRTFLFFRNSVAYQYRTINRVHGNAYRFNLFIVRYLLGTVYTIISVCGGFYIVFGTVLGKLVWETPIWLVLKPIGLMVIAFRLVKLGVTIILLEDYEKSKAMLESLLE